MTQPDPGRAPATPYLWTQEDKDWVRQFHPDIDRYTPERLEKLGRALAEVRASQASAARKRDVAHSAATANRQWKALTMEPALTWSTFLPGLLLAAVVALVLLLALRPWVALRMAMWSVTLAGMLLTLFGAFSLQGEFRHEARAGHWEYQRRWAYVAIVVGGTMWVFGSIWLYG